MHRTAEPVRKSIVFQFHLKPTELGETSRTVCILMPDIPGHAVCLLILHQAKTFVQDEKRILVANLQQHIYRVEVPLSRETFLGSDLLHKIRTHHLLCVSPMDLSGMEIHEEALFHAIRERASNGFSVSIITVETYQASIPVRAPCLPTGQYLLNGVFRHAVITVHTYTELRIGIGISDIVSSIQAPILFPDVTEILSRAATE